MNDTKCGAIASFKFLQLKFSDNKGRYLVSKEPFKPGDEVISEATFAAVPPDMHAAHKSDICQFCFKRIAGSAVKCFGCHTAKYCKEECKRTDWKLNHWMECVMENVLSKMETDVRMSLRVLLNAAHQLTNEKDEESLSYVARSLTSSSQCPDGCVLEDNKRVKLYRGCYWSVFCLQTHKKEPKALQYGDKMMKHINVLVSLLHSCFLWLENFKGIKSAEQPNRSMASIPDSYLSTKSLLQTVFKNLCFLSYCDTEEFDIRSWRSAMHAFCGSAHEKLSKFSQSSKEVLSSVPGTTEQCITRLLLHHAMQMRTNGQAIYKLFETSSDDTKMAEGIEQRRIGVGYFPVISLMNHSCSPNTTINFEGRTMKVVATKSIRKGEEVLHCYGPECRRYSLEQRRKILSEQYFFHCECDVCNEEAQDEELRSYRLQFVGFKCKYCDDPLQEVPDLGSLRAKCINTKCGKEQDLEESFVIRQHANEMFMDGMRLFSKEDVKAALNKLLESLKQMKSVLYHNAVDIAKVNDAIARCYILQKEYSHALSHLCQSIKIIGMLHGTDSVEMGHELMKLASVHFNLGDYRNAAKKAKQVMAIFQKFFPNPESRPPGTTAMEYIMKLSSDN